MQLATLTPMLPEIVIALGAMALLMAGAFQPAANGPNAGHREEIGRAHV